LEETLRKTQRGNLWGTYLLPPGVLQGVIHGVIHTVKGAIIKSNFKKQMTPFKLHIAVS
jgi:hypothetical protein